MILRPVSWVYAGLSGLNGWRRSLGAYRASVPVVSIGNLSVGGTGKTPHTLHAAEVFSGAGYRPSVFLRGYAPDGVQDESLIYQRHLGDGHVFVDPNRSQKIREAENAGGTDVALLDDGFQHRQVCRDLDIVLIDALRPATADCVMPAGLLRENLSALKRADCVVITRSEQAGRETVTEICRVLKNRFPELLLYRSRLALSGYVNTKGDPVMPPKGEGVFLCAAIGNPEGFEKVAREAGISITGSRFLSDHSAFHAGTREELIRLARKSGARALLMTEKDIVKWGEGTTFPVMALTAKPEIFPLYHDLSFDDYLLQVVKNCA